MSTLVENVEKVKSAHAALSASIEAKGVSVPAGTNLTGMPDLVDLIQTGGGGTPEQTNPRANLASDTSTSITVPSMLIVDMTLITDLNSCFFECKDLSSLTLPDGFGQNATDISYCFNGCESLTSLTLPSGFGQNATNLSYCFYFCLKLKNLTLPDGFGQNAINLSNCFLFCLELANLTLPDGFGQNAINLSNCFDGCSRLESLTLPSGFGQNATNLSKCFDGCSYLTNITGNPNFKASLNLSSTRFITHDSLMVVINGLQTVTTTQTLTLGSTNLAKLTDEEKKIATDKGWTLE